MKKEIIGTSLEELLNKSLGLFLVILLIFAGFIIFISIYIYEKNRKLEEEEKEKENININGLK